ncbi:dehydrogenase [Acinetobacter baumannii]|uniref:SDR family NAD(P)-dependent oxidoreductase n=1 Tax=Acinetobacter baumannii TaxID=470 RepID=UPI000707EA4E|nr:SDR family NAD(P)-dependent oxidoreductase [Acinetobacter baumannii]KQG96716.1 dehydrogenase [Acinetobacter baumannii]
MSVSKRILITGANSGIGFATAENLLKKGNNIVLACRDEEKAKKAQIDLLAKGYSGEVDIVLLDLNSLKSVKEAADLIKQKYEYIDVLINNAGVYREKLLYTEDGYEQQFGVNYLGPFLFTHLLLPSLHQAKSGRVIHLSSIMHWLGDIKPATFRMEQGKYLASKAYGQSKLANLLFSNALAQKLEGTNVTSNAVHPGVINSDMYRDLSIEKYLAIRPILISPDIPAKLISDMALSSAWEGRNGHYESAHMPNWQSRKAKDLKLRDRLYSRSLKLVKDYL